MAKKPRYSEDQIRAVVAEAEAGAAVEELCARYDIAASTLTRWRARYAAAGASAARRIRHLEEENQRLRSLVADLTLSNQALKLAVSKKW